MACTVFGLAILLSGGVDQVKACCDDGPCGAAGQCVNMPSPFCGGSAGEGVCVNNLETCSGDGDCPSGQSCIGSLCRAVEDGECPCERKATLLQIQKEEAFYPISNMTSITGLSDMQ